MFNKIILACFCVLLTVSAKAETLSATIEWDDKVRLSFGVDGLVEKVNVAAGQLVAENTNIGALIQTPFALNIKKMQARIAQLEPQLFDAKLELERAQELFDRTVLSEIELQKIAVIHKGLLAEKAAAQADLELAQYQQQQSILRIKKPMRVLSVNMQRGDVINAYTQAEKYIELASVETVLASADISLATALAIKHKKDFSVHIADKKYRANMYSLQRIQNTDQYRMRVRIVLPNESNVLAAMDVEIEY